jgi:methyl-accepting chemotaxis protein
MSHRQRKGAVSSIKVKLEGEAYRDVVVGIDGFIDEVATKLEDIEATVADIHRMMLEQQADLSLVMKKVGAVGILSAGGGSEHAK